MDGVGKNLWHTVGKVLIPPPPFKDFPFLEIQYVPTFIGLLGKQKYWKTFLSDLYVISTLKSILILEEINKSGKMQTWYNAFKCFPANFMKSGCQLEKGI